METLRHYTVITLGLLVVAVGIHVFLVPSNIAAGGAMGIAIVVSKFVPYATVGEIMLVVNVLLFGLAFLFLGLGFGVRSVYASLGLSGLLWVLEELIPIPRPLTNDLLLATLMGVLISGFGMGVIFNEDASSGGTDIIAKMINRWTHLDIGKALFLTDGIVTLAAMFSFGFEKGTYALLGVIANGYVVDYVVEGLSVSMQVFVVSRKASLISTFIMNNLERGVTFIAGRGAYSGHEQVLIYSIIGRRELVTLKNYIREVDPRAFVAVSAAHEVLGEGFRRIS